MTDKMRGEFEAWAALHWLHCAHKPVKMLDGEYLYNELQSSWESWIASRESVELALPDADDAFEYHHGGTTYFDGAEYRDACVKAIEAAGLKVKP